ncbi:aromatic-ring hydroxylase C-terminal domain-containing protein [Mycobacterium szulgai]|uniref:aromatic-ring hydroxylase C-terminal domain-containing protein n=1 Tax=Mycobacterium szulgai TaxID=1787 RepID=UPI0035585575
MATAAAAAAGRVTIAHGRPIGSVSATAMLVRPDGYVAWASSEPEPDAGELRRVLARWFGIAVSEH